MLQLIIRKIFSKKWMIISLLTGNILLIAVACSCALYENAVLQKMLTANLANELEETEMYPGLTMMRNTVKLPDSDLEHSQYEKLGKKAPGFAEDMGLEESYFISRHYRNVTLIPQIRSSGEDADDRSAVLAVYNDFANHVQITAGRMYEPGIQDGGIIEVVIPKRTLVYMNLMIGETLTIRNGYGSKNPVYSVRVVGAFEAADPEDLYWYLNPSRMYQTMIMDEGTFLDEFVNGEPDHRTPFYVEWVSVVDYRTFRGRNVAGMLQTMKTYEKAFNVGTPSGFRAYYQPVFEDYMENAGKLRITLLVLQIPIFVLLIVFIFMVAGQMLEMEQKEIAVFKSRGASKRQILLLYLLQSTILAGTGLVIGMPLGVAICQILGSANAFLEFVGRSALPIALTWKTVLFSLAAALLSIAAMVIPAIKYSDVTIVRHTQKKAGKKKRPLWQTLFADVILLLLAGYIVFLYRENTDYIKQTIASGATLGPLMYLGSSIFILGAALLVLRLFPLIVKLVFMIGKKFWTPALYASFLRILRDRGSQGFLMVFLMMTMALGIFNAQAARTINENGEDRIRYLTGADLVVKEAWDIATGMDGTGDYLEPDYNKYLNLEEAESITRVLRDSVMLSTSDGHINGVNLMAIRTKEFGETAWMKTGWLPTHWYHYLNAMSQNPDSVLVSSNLKTAAGFKVGDVIYFSNKHGSGHGVICGFVDYWPGYAPVVEREGEMVDNYLIVSSFDQIQSQWSLIPYEIWMKVKDSTRFIYDWAEEKNVRFATFKDAQASLIAWKNDPVTQGTNGVLTVGFIVVLILCAVGFLIFWILSIRSRELQFGIFRAMGMSMREILGMLGNEQLFVSGISLVMGAVIGRVCAYLYVPMVQLAYAAADTVIPLQIAGAQADTLRLYIVIGIVVAACMAVIGWLIRRIRISQALKLGED